MKKFLFIAFMIAMIFVSGCGNKKTAEQPAPEAKKDDKVASILLKDSLWVMDSENMRYLNDAISRKDAEYLEQLIIEHKVFLVKKDTKVTRFGKAAGKNNVLIVFDEGRYTNKTGCTHASNVVAEKDFPAYLETQRKKKIALIQDSLMSTEKYSEVIASGNLEEIERLSRHCLNKTNELKKFRFEQQRDNDVLEQAEMAIDIIFKRDNVLWDYKYSRECDI